MEHGTWNMEHGTWNMEQGTRKIVALKINGYTIYYIIKNIKQNGGIISQIARRQKFS